MTIKFQIIQWFSKDEEDYEIDRDDNLNIEYPKKYKIYCFGRSEEGQGVTCKIKNYNPHYYIKVSDDFNNQKLQNLLHFMNRFKSCNPNIDKDKELSSIYFEKCCIVSRKDIYGFNNSKIFKYVKIVFKNESSFIKSKYIFKKPVQINGVCNKPQKFDLYESNFEPFIKFCHEKNIECAGWVQVSKYKKIKNEASTDICIEIDYDNIEPVKEEKNAGFLQASFDIEVYSFDYTFPSPLKKPNEIYQIATIFKKTDSDTYKSYLLTLKKVDKSCFEKNIEIIECKNECELLEKWSIMINENDPDIFYTYNGDAFDCNYIYKRCLLYGNQFLNKVMRNLSRLKDHPSIIKKEKFSSSAYGDSDFDRLYITGRLNYDLLIHFKRGMVKYPSYKLDYIANEILGEGKDDVSAKEIFKYYEEGDPKKLSIIGNYCLQDTILLQKLVDKQLILVNIIQLANITFVPAQYLSTRGQTIKCISQILRKANKMNFLVPHTNFNEEKYLLKIKFKKEMIKIIEGDYIILKCENHMFDFCFKVENITDNVIEGTSDCDIFENNIISIKYNNITIKAENLSISSIDNYENSFTGATVLEPESGYYPDNVAILDFASLYPTIMIGYNLCFSTIVLDEQFLQKDIDFYNLEWDDNIEIVLKHICEGVYKTGIKKDQICGKQAFFKTDDDKYYCRVHDPIKKERTEKNCTKKVSYNYKIVQKSQNGDNIGVLPSLLEELYTQRKKVKKLMNDAEKNNNKELGQIYNSTQNAIKISLNSIYGFLGRSVGNLAMKPLGSIVTYLGRNLINTSKIFVENEFLKYINTEENAPKYQL